MAVWAQDFFLRWAVRETLAQASPPALGGLLAIFGQSSARILGFWKHYPNLYLSYLRGFSLCACLCSCLRFLSFLFKISFKILFLGNLCTQCGVQT